MSLVLNTISEDSILEWTTVFSYTTPVLESPKFWLQNRKCFFQVTNIGICENNGNNYLTKIRIESINASALPDLFDMTYYVKTSSKEWGRIRQMVNIERNIISHLSMRLPSEVLPGPEERTYVFIFHGDVGSTVRLATEEETASTSLSISDPVRILSHDLPKLLGGDFFHDVEVKCREHTFKAHRSMLSCRSNVFLAMLQSDLVEGQTARVNIKDMDPNVCKEFLQYLYTGELSGLTQDTARGLYEAGDRYNVGGLMKLCAEFLSRNLTDDNALDMLVLADGHSDDMLKENVMKYILDRKLPLQDDIWRAFYDCQPKLSYEVLNRAYRNNILRKYLEKVSLGTNSI